MEIPEDDVGVELMNERFREMGILIADEDGYKIDPEFVKRIDDAVRRELGADISAEDPAYRRAVVAELKSMGIPAGFEDFVGSWVVHAKRVESWDDE
jgi:hypothetical protein